MIKYSTQFIDDDDVKAVVQSLTSEYLTQGPCIEKFEAEMARYTEAKFASAVCNATAGLHIACMALGVNEKSIVWTSPNSFAASSNCALYCGATVDFVDINLTTYNMCTTKLEEKLIHAKKQNRLPHVLIPVHLGGQSCDMKRIHELSKEYEFKIIEDASHALGGEYFGRKIGSCQYSDIAILSFHPVKMITTGEGGMLLTNDESLQNKFQAYRSHGIVKVSTPYPWSYEQQVLGYNYRVTEMQAALGLSQMKKLDMFVSKRRQIAEKYKTLLADIPVHLHLDAANSKMSYHLYVIRFKEKKHVERKAGIFNFMKDKGVGTQVHYMPIYHHPYYQKLGFKNGYCANAEQYYLEALSIPNHPKLTDDEQLLVVKTLKEALQ